MEKATVSALSNMRPQHLTDAFMIRPIEPNNSLFYVQSEFFQEEPDTRPGKKNARVMRSYYLLEELSQSGGDAKLLRRFWLDRVGGIHLARVQSYDDRERLITDVSYYNEKVIGNGVTASLPSRIEITRPLDRYKLSITYQDSASIELNREYMPKAFVLENKWRSLQYSQIILKKKKNCQKKKKKKILKKGRVGGIFLGGGGGGGAGCG